jgi:hypothetical protein
MCNLVPLGRSACNLSGLKTPKFGNLLLRCLFSKKLEPQETKSALYLQGAFRFAYTEYY